jgi:hypothetical protein
MKVNLVGLVEFILDWLLHLGLLLSGYALRIK